MRLSQTEAAVVMAEVNAEKWDVAAEHCSYLMRQGLTPDDAIHLIGMKGGRGWGGTIAAYASRWAAIQRRQVLDEGLS